MMSKQPFHFHIVLVEPEIPPNTGNAGRLCVATNSTLHIVGKPAFSLDDKEVRRAGLDYWKFVDIKTHENFDSWLEWRDKEEADLEFYLFSTKGKNNIFSQKIPSRAAFIFGKETKGLPLELVEKYAQRCIQIPMFSDRIRSLNLSNAISIVLYEGIRQTL